MVYLEVKKKGGGVE